MPLAAVAQQFFDYVALMEALDVEVAADYLAIAATLVFLKSRSLLPAIPAAFLASSEESPEEVEQKLRARLVAYSSFKAVAEVLRTRRDEAEAFFFREAGDATTELVQRYRIASQTLPAALLAALRAAKPEKRTLVRERFSIAQQMTFLLRAVRERGAVEFGELCRDLDRAEIIATFLAILELIRQRRLECEQATAAEPLRLLAFAPRDVSEN